MNLKANNYNNSNNINRFNNHISINGNNNKNDLMVDNPKSEENKQLFTNNYNKLQNQKV